MEHAEFFKCLEPGSKSWLSQVERNVEADMFARNILAGVKTVEGSFARGDTVSIVTLQGREIARGLVAYDAGDAARILGLKS